MKWRNTDGSTYDVGLTGGPSNVGPMPVQITSGALTLGAVDTELPAAAALTDADANPTAPYVGSAGMVFGGTTWARIRQVTGDAMALTGVLAAGAMLWNGATLDRWKGDNTGAGRVSLYAKSAAAADTPLKSDAAGRLNMTSYDSSGTEVFVLGSGDGQATGGAPIAQARGMIYSGTTWDRLRGFFGITDGTAQTGVGAAGLVAWDGTNAYRLRLISSSTLGLRVALFDGSNNQLATGTPGDAQTNTITVTKTYSYLTGYNGTTWDRLRTVNTGQLVVSQKDSGGNESLVSTAGADAVANATNRGQELSAVQLFNGTTWDRLRSIAGDAQASTGILACGLMGYNGTNYDRLVVDASKQLKVTAQDNGPAWTSSFGVGSARFTSADATTAAAITDAPTAGQKIVVTDVLVSTDTAMRVDLQCETTAVVIASVYLPASGTFQWTPRSKTKLATADKRLMVKASVAGNIAATPHYYSEA